jgi:hypothetical protein
MARNAPQSMNNWENEINEKYLNKNFQVSKDPNNLNTQGIDQEFCDGNDIHHSFDTMLVCTVNLNVRLNPAGNWPTTKNYAPYFRGVLFHWNLTWRFGLCHNHIQYFLCFFRLELKISGQRAPYVAKWARKSWNRNWIRYSIYLFCFLCITWLWLTLSRATYQEKRHKKQFSDQFLMLGNK